MPTHLPRPVPSVPGQASRSSARRLASLDTWVAWLLRRRTFVFARSCCLCAVLGLWGSCVASQSRAPEQAVNSVRDNLATQIERVDDRCNGMASATDGSAKRYLLGRVEGDVKRPQQAPEWTAFERDDTLADLVEQSRVYDVAEVWVLPDRSVALRLSLSDASGTWTQLVESCYRPDGSLARMEATLNLLAPSGGAPSGISRFRARYFFPNGTLAATKSSVRDRATAQPFKGTFTDRDAPLYPSIARLPFAPQISFENAGPTF